MHVALDVAVAAEGAIEKDVIGPECSLLVAANQTLSAFTEQRFKRI